MITELVHKALLQTLNIFKLREFPSVEDIESMPDCNNPEEAKHVEELFEMGDELEPQAISILFQHIEDCFIEHLMVNRLKSLPKFGSTDDKYQEAMSNYKFSVMEKHTVCQKQYKATHGVTYSALEARVAYVLHEVEKDLAQLPLLSILYVGALDYELGRIPNILKEVSKYLLFTFKCKHCRILSFDNMQLYQ